MIIENNANEFNIQEYAREFAKRQSQFLFERLIVIPCEYVGFKILVTFPDTDNKYHELTFVGEYHYSFIGADNEEELKRCTEQGYSMCKKSELKKYKSVIE